MTVKFGIKTFPNILCGLLISEILYEISEQHLYALSWNIRIDICRYAVFIRVRIKPDVSFGIRGVFIFSRIFMAFRFADLVLASIIIEQQFYTKATVAIE